MVGVLPLLPCGLPRIPDELDVLWEGWVGVATSQSPGRTENEELAARVPFWAMLTEDRIVFLSSKKRGNAPVWWLDLSRATFHCSQGVAAEGDNQDGRDSGFLVIARQTDFLQCFCWWLSAVRKCFSCGEQKFHVTPATDSRDVGLSDRSSTPLAPGPRDPVGNSCVESFVLKFHSNDIRNYVAYLIESARLRTRGFYDSRLISLSATLCQLHASVAKCRSVASQGAETFRSEWCTSGSGEKIRVRSGVANVTVAPPAGYTAATKESSALSVAGSVRMSVSTTCAADTGGTSTVPPDTATLRLSMDFCDGSSAASTRTPLPSIIRCSSTPAIGGSRQTFSSAALPAGRLHTSASVPDGTGNVACTLSSSHTSASYEQLPRRMGKLRGSVDKNSVLFGKNDEYCGTKPLRPSVCKMPLAEANCGTRAPPQQTQDLSGAQCPTRRPNATWESLRSDSAARSAKCAKCRRTATSVALTCCRARTRINKIWALRNDSRMLLSESLKSSSFTRDLFGSSTVNVYANDSPRRQRRNIRFFDFHVESSDAVGGQLTVEADESDHHSDSSESTDDFLRVRLARAHRNTFFSSKARTLPFYSLLPVGTARQFIPQFWQSSPSTICREHSCLLRRRCWKESPNIVNNHEPQQAHSSFLHPKFQHCCCSSRRSLSQPQPTHSTTASLVQSPIPDEYIHSLFKEDLFNKHVSALLPVLSSITRQTKCSGECAFCLSSFEATDIVARFPLCPHVFHFDCLYQWVEYQHYQTNARLLRKLQAQYRRSQQSNRNRIGGSWTIIPHFLDSFSPRETFMLLDESSGFDFEAQVAPLLRTPGAVNRFWICNVAQYPTKFLQSTSLLLTTFRVRCPLCQANFIS